MTTIHGSYPCRKPRATGDFPMPDTTHRSVGDSRGETHLPIYQGLVAVKCRTCTKTHKMMFTSDEREAVEHHAAAYERILRTGGYSPSSIIVESFHPGTDLDMREWAALEAMLDDQDTQEVPW